MAQILFTVSLNLLVITNDYDNYDYMRTKPKAKSDHMETGALPIDLISKSISYHLPKGKFILHYTLFNMVTGIQIKFQQDTTTHTLKKILNVKSVQSTLSHLQSPPE